MYGSYDTSEDSSKRFRGLEHVQGYLLNMQAGGAGHLQNLHNQVTASLCQDDHVYLLGVIPEQ